MDEFILEGRVIRLRLYREVKRFRLGFCLEFFFKGWMGSGVEER